MYAKVKSCVRFDDGLTKLFAYKRGLRQGCILSPLLFALFLNDLNNFLLDGAEGITLWDTRLCAMLYADDLILVAEPSATYRLKWIYWVYTQTFENGNKPKENKSASFQKIECKK